jgi:DNA-binding protein H-NS
MDSYQSLLDRISVLQKKASALRETEKKRVVSEIRKLIDQYDVQPAELFSDAKPRPGRPPSAAASVSAAPSTGGRGRGKPGRPANSAKPAKSAKPSKLSKPPKYQDPVTGKTWNGHGKTPFWLVNVSDRTAFLIDAQAESTSDMDMAKPKETQKIKGVVGRKPKAPKGTAKQKRAGKRNMASQEGSANSFAVS